MLFIQIHLSTEDLEDFITFILSCRIEIICMQLYGRILRMLKEIFQIVTNSKISQYFVYLNTPVSGLSVSNILIPGGMRRCIIQFFQMQFKENQVCQIV